MSIVSSSPRNYGARKLVDRLMRGLAMAATLAAIVPLVLIVGYVAVIGGGALNQDFFTQTYEPPVVSAGDVPLDFSLDGDTGGAAPAEAPIGQVEARGGVLHSIVGTLLITGLALLFSLPVGILAGVFLSEFPANPVATAVRFCTDLLSGAPSIVAGVTAYILIVVHYRQFSAVAGAIALTFLMVPTIVRTTEEVLKLVPESTREAALALGAPMWRTTFTVVIPAALSGIITGVMLAFARGAGETAPLLLTVLGSNTLSLDVFKPMAALPLMTYRYTESPFPTENAQAWGTAFVLMMVVLTMNILVRVATRNRLRGR
jgi:phosphate transport system permease protein